jgi:HPt (histidine-containing phosphotransfer) domain-containing protein
MSNPVPDSLRPATSVLIDAAAVNTLASDVGVERLGLVLDAFCSELVRRVPLLEAAIDAADLAAIQRESHSLKGSALTFGATALGAAARRANDASRAGDAVGALEAGRAALDLVTPTLEAVRGLMAMNAENSSQ